jgi:hypothetical protein
MKMQGRAHARVVATILLIEHSLAGWRGEANQVQTRQCLLGESQTSLRVTVGFLGRWLEEQSSLETRESVRGVLEEWQDLGRLG